MNTQKSEVNWSMVCHFSGLASYVGIPLLNVIAPLCIWLAKRHEDPRLNQEGKEAVNFNLSFTLYALVSTLLITVLIGYALLAVVVVTHVILTIRAGLAANKLQAVEYPFTLRFVK